MRFLKLAERNMKELFRDPITLILGSIMPAGLLVLFVSMNKRVPLEIFSAQMLTPGIVIFSFTIMIMFAGTLLAKDRKSALMMRLYTTPLRTEGYLISYLIPFIPLAIFQIFVCLFVSKMLGASLGSFLAAIIIYLLIAIICTCLGIFLGSICTLNQINGIGSLLITAMSLFSGAWMDLKMFGGIFEKVGYALPFAHGVDAGRILHAGGQLNEVGISFSWIIVYTIFSIVLAYIGIYLSRRKVQ